MQIKEMHLNLSKDSILNALLLFLLYIVEL